MIQSPKTKNRENKYNVDTINQLKIKTTK